MKNICGVWRFAGRYLKAVGGTTAIEYALIAVGISIGISVLVFTIGDELFNLYDIILTGLDEALAKI